MRCYRSRKYVPSLQYCTVVKAVKVVPTGPTRSGVPGRSGSNVTHPPCHSRCRTSITFPLQKKTTSTLQTLHGPFFVWLVSTKVARTIETRINLHQGTPTWRISLNGFFVFQGVSMLLAASGGDIGKKIWLPRPVTTVHVRLCLRQYSAHLRGCLRVQRRCGMSPGLTYEAA